MRAAAISILLACLALSAPPVRELTLLSWNIHHGYDPQQIAVAIRAENPDIVALQEVDFHAKRTQYAEVARVLAEALRFEFQFGQAYEELNQGTKDRPAFEGQATLTRLAITGQRNFLYRRQSGFWKPAPYLPSWFPQRRLGGRTALVTELDAEGKRLVLYNLHLESREPFSIRADQLKETLADAKTYPGNIPVVLAGDFNSKLGTGTFDRILETDGFHDCAHGHRERTHHLFGSLDWIAVRGPITCDSVRVVKAAEGSDHYPLVTHLRLR